MQLEAVRKNFLKQINSSKHHAAIYPYPVQSFFWIIPETPNKKSDQQA